MLSPKSTKMSVSASGAFLPAFFHPSSMLAAWRMERRSGGGYEGSGTGLGLLGGLLRTILFIVLVFDIFLEFKELYLENVDPH